MRVEKGGLDGRDGRDGRGSWEYGGLWALLVGTVIRADVLECEILRSCVGLARIGVYGPASEWPTAFPDAEALETYGS